jgi:hypothetical protein
MARAAFLNPGSGFSPSTSQPFSYWLKPCQAAPGGRHSTYGHHWRDGRLLRAFWTVQVHVPVTIGVGKAFASPPSEPCRQFSRTRLSSRQLPHRGRPSNGFTSGRFHRSALPRRPADTTFRTHPLAGTHFPASRGTYQRDTPWSWLPLRRCLHLPTPLPYGRFC